MELKKSFDIRKIIIPLYVVSFLIYLMFGLLPAEATQYTIATKLEIPRIGLVSDVATLKLKNHVLETPADIVGSFTREENKVFLFGHVGTVFEKLSDLAVGDEIIYNSMIYYVESMMIVEKSMINMDEILRSEDEKTIVLMTCAGEELTNGDATHRLIVTAKV